MDDDPALVAAAIALGYQGSAMLRDSDGGGGGEGNGGAARADGVPVISSLTEVLDLV